MNKKTSGQIFFRGIFLMFIFGGDIVQEIRKFVPVIGEEGSEGLLGWTIFGVFFGPLLLYIIFSRLEKPIKERFGQTMETHLSVINELSNADGVNGNGIQQTGAGSSNALGGEMIGYNAKTVTGEIVNPFSIDGN